jgi:alanyl-tRNA synthetase
LNFEVIKSSVDGILSSADKVHGATLVTHVFKDLDMETLRRVSDLIKLKCPTVVQVLGAAAGEDAALIISVSDDLVKKNIKANDLIKTIAPLMGGSGGGRPNMAQAGSKDTSKLASAIDAAKKIVKETLGA